VDVVNTPKNQKHSSRRRSDSAENWDRAQDWSVRSSDIELHPHSPLAIADILTQNDGRLDLLADVANRPVVTPTSEVTPLIRTKSSKTRRSKANLLTRHSTEELAERCKRIQVTNALVKQPGIQSLYVAAGFLGLKHADSARRTRAPLLLFPAILSKKEALDHGATRGFELQLQSSVPDLNLELIDVVQDRWNLRLPKFNSDEPLATWYANVAEAIRDIDQISLEFDIAIGTALRPTHLTELADGSPWLPELPEHFDAALAMAITKPLDLQQLSDVMQLIGEPTEFEHHWSRIEAANDGGSAIGELHQLALQLAEVGLERVEFRHLDDLPTRLHRWIENVRKTVANPVLESFGSKSSLTALQVIRLSSMVELIDREPNNFAEYRHSHLAFKTTRSILRRAHHQAKLIEQELNDLQSHFRLDRVPAKKQLLSLIDDLGGNTAVKPDVVDADYFNARRQFIEFSVDKPAHLTLEHQRALHQLAKVLRFRELFVNNTEYRQALGPGYRGLQTDWNELDSMIQYSAELSTHLESDDLAARLLDNWPACRSLYVTEFEQLQEGAEALHKLLRVIGTAERHSPLHTLLPGCTLLADNLQTWRTPELDLTAYHSHTAADVLACFSGLDNADAHTEAVVVATEQRIREHIKDQSTEPRAIVDTLIWLLQACETASRQSLNIDVIVRRRSAN